MIVILDLASHTDVLYKVVYMFGHFPAAKVSEPGWWRRSQWNVPENACSYPPVLLPAREDCSPMVWVYRLKDKQRQNETEYLKT